MNINKRKRLGSSLESKQVCLEIQTSKFKDVFINRKLPRSFEIIKKINCFSKIYIQILLGLSERRPKILD